MKRLGSLGRACGCRPFQVESTHKYGSAATQPNGCPCWVLWAAFFSAKTLHSFPYAIRTISAHSLYTLQCFVGFQTQVGCSKSLLLLIGLVIKHQLFPWLCLGLSSWMTRSHAFLSQLSLKTKHLGTHLFSWTEGYSYLIALFAFSRLDLTVLLYLPAQEYKWLSQKILSDSSSFK